jgi:SM-20-related protein
MAQISEHIFCDDFLTQCDIENRLLPNPYYDFPYLIIEDFLSPFQCHEIVTSKQKDSNAQKAMVKSMLHETVLNPTVDESIRKTKIYKLTELHQAWYDESFLAHQKEMEAFFNIALTTATKVQVLEYTQGYFYNKHADDSSELVNKERETIGFKCVAPNRKLTTVLFVSSHEANRQEKDEVCFSGGELVFNYLYNSKGEPIVLQPKAGNMVVFPSNPYFSHEVKPVISGYRLTCAQWHNGLL